jgi:hypothetical protein
MLNLPHDVTDLYLAPVVLALDARVQELARLDLAELTTEVAVVANTAGWTEHMREAGLLATVRNGVECHDWTLSWDPRGLRVGHASHELVLGVPATFRAYLAGAERPDAQDVHV